MDKDVRRPIRFFSFEETETKLLSFGDSVSGRHRMVVGHEHFLKSRLKSICDVTVPFKTPADEGFNRMLMVMNSSVKRSLCLWGGDRALPRQGAANWFF